MHLTAYRAIATAIIMLTCASARAFDASPLLAFYGTTASSFSWTATGSYYSTNYTEGGTNFTAVVWTNGSGTWVPSASVVCEVLVVAGGGGGGQDVGGGGGAGGYIFISKTNLAAGTHAVAVGVGGSGGTSGVKGGNGGNSSIAGQVAIGGGGGGSYQGTSTGVGNGATGGSGGGGTGYGYPGNPGSGTTNQGYAGGAAGPSGASTTGSGGGGAASAGAQGISMAGSFAEGGASKTNSMLGVAAGFAKGGRGASDSWADWLAPTVVNRGNGGDALGSAPNDGVAGGSGIVIVRYVRAP
jgi:fibronectin-binding autotransporter adhesin